MKIYLDATEIRSGTKLDSAVIKSGKSIIGLERLTGADILLSLNGPELPAKLSDNVPHRLALKKNCENGLLIQRKSSGDLLSSVKKLEEILVRMQEWTPVPWLLVTGIFVENRGSVKIGYRRTMFPYMAMIGALDAWQIRGGGITMLSEDNLTEKWLEDMGKRLAKVQCQKSKVLTPHKQQIVGKIDPCRTPVLHTMMSFPGVGPQAATTMADRFERLADALVWFGSKDREGKIKGIGPGMIKQIRDWLGLKSRERLLVEKE